MASQERPIIRVLFESATVLVGDENCLPSHPAFGRETFSCMWPFVAFPSVPVGVTHEHFGAVVGDSNTALVYNVGPMSRRTALDARGSQSSWIDVEPRVLAEMVAEFDPGARERGAAPFAWGNAPVSPEVHLAQRLNYRRVLGGCFDALEVEETSLAAVRAVVAAGYAVRDMPRRRRLSELHARFHKEAVEEVCSTLSRRMTDRVTLTDLSRAVHVSQFHLCRLFRRHTGTSIHRYLDHLRLRRAMEMIEGNGRTMAQIALAVGYVSESHFSDAFKRGFGLRPSEFRARLNGRGHSGNGAAPARELIDARRLCPGPPGAR